MAALSPLALDKATVRSDLKAFKALLDDTSKPSLSEAQDILPFFKERPHLCALMGTYNPNIIDYRKIGVACEFDIFGDHVADLVVGDMINHAYCLVEFEDAGEGSIFKKSTKKTPEWSARFEHGFSQLVDWILWLENNKGNTAFKTRFGTPTISYNVLLILGRDKYIASPDLRERMDWRTDQVVIASKKFHCITFDKLYADLRARSRFLR